MKYFVDTSAIVNNKFDWSLNCYISTSTIKELQEHSYNTMLRKIRNSPNIKVYIYNSSMDDEILKLNVPLKDIELQILAAAAHCDRTTEPDNLIFLTEDDYLYNVANLIFGEDSIKYISEI